ncbi:MAG: phosphate propanoyltransferase [Peptococcaceae bacterium]|nr:phosphate propanoyltransferase [Peptococcaceae bacterium]
MASKEYEAILEALLEAVQAASQPSAAPQTSPAATGAVPVGISNRHIHLSQADLDALFGAGYALTPMKDLSQPGQFACKETVTICGPKGAIEKVRVLGPVRSATQVEIVAGDSFKLGVKAPVRLSGDLAGSPGITIVGPKGSVQLAQGVVVAQRHIHMNPADAQALGVHDGQIVKIAVEGARGGVYNNVAIRVTNTSQLECHLDTEEANAMGVTAQTSVTIVQ